MNLIKRLNDWISLHFSRDASPWLIYFYLVVGSTLETTVVPVPFELIIIPLMLTHREKIWQIAFSAFIGCLIGSGLGYLAGAMFFDHGGLRLLQAFGTEGAFESFQKTLEQDGFLAIFLVGFTPVPLQAATVGAGFAGYSLGWFSAAIVASRLLRYGAVALLVIWLGPRTLTFIENHRPWAIGIGLVLTVVLIFILIP